MFSTYQKLTGVLHYTADGLRQGSLKLGGVGVIKDRPLFWAMAIAIGMMVAIFAGFVRANRRRR